MKLLAFFALFGVLAYASAIALPDVYDGPTYELQPIDGSDTSSDIGSTRMRRLTCDVFSFQSQWVSPNHSACAIKCVFQGRKGGTCQNGVCVCRR
ncbi:PREDICTED: defensin-2-like [Dinoponera quadriceps]|uniref:Defensin-2-like n=1 Tax=Dinoponera quadriceps TaxID=609295 RepID=A0A6P3XD17_DINQU|nr:PREDICTED: defensin-2-like [Dinoponera quadriceps]